MRGRRGGRALSNLREEDGVWEEEEDVWDKRRGGEGGREEGIELCQRNG